MKTGATFLTEGLRQSYTGKTIPQTITRGGFTLKQGHYEKDGGVYHDEWLPHRTGGGQELARIGQETYTRVYAGGVVEVEKLKALGITEKDVIDYLMKKINQLGEKTRLFDDCRPSQDGNWQYAYTITDRAEEVELTRSLETIDYKGVRVFVHGFEICRVR